MDHKPEKSTADGQAETPSDDYNLENEDANRLLKGIEAIVPGIVRKTILGGISSIGEEGLKALADNKNLPKDAVGFVLNSADSTRKEVLRIVSREIRVFLENMDFGGEIAKILTTLSFEIRTEIRFVPNNEAVKPSVKNKIKLKRQKEDGKFETITEKELDETDEDEVESTESPRRKRWSRSKASSSKSENQPENEPSANNDDD